MYYRSLNNLSGVVAIMLALMWAPTGCKAKHPQATLKTNMGEIVLQLDAEAAPLSVANFKMYCQSGHYNNTIFHRVIPNFMVQAGGFTPSLQKKPTKTPIKNEAGNGLKNLRGTVAMARTSVVDSATAQFFINVVDNASLDHKDTSPRGFGYAVFGKVIKGMQVADSIVNLPRGVQNGMKDVPSTQALIEDCTWNE